MTLYCKKEYGRHSLYWCRINSNDLYMTVKVFGVMNSPEIWRFY